MQRYNKIIAFLFLFFGYRLSIEIPYNKTIHQTDPEAKCLDGSPPAIYVHQGKQKENLLIFIQGGGLCEGANQG